jgi:FPC/CPF motif-containing protein YcgG
MAVIVPPAIARRVRDDFSAFVSRAEYPCLGARSAMRRGGCRVVVYGAMGTEDTSSALAVDLRAYARAAPDAASFSAFVAVFIETAPGSEAEFETALWRQLSLLSSVDDAAAWADGVSDDPEDPHFAFSFARTAYFVIGLHPESSRLARQFGWPALVFNPHSQFRQLRAQHRFERLRHAIRVRDVALQGDVNPNLADAGERSEARQYSGRAADETWRCPFHRDRA